MARNSIKLHVFAPDDWVKYQSAEYISENRPPLIGRIRIDGHVADVVRSRDGIGVYWSHRGSRQFLFQDNLGRVRKALRSEMTVKELRELGGEERSEGE